MDSIQNLRQQLVGEKEKIIKSINLHKSLVSALWRLPTEVLSHIFRHCLPEIREFNQLKKPSVLEAPILLTTVCRRWREVAVTMHSLWCRLAVSVDHEGQWKRQIFCYKLWLKRSRGCPLSLAFYSHNVHMTEPRYYAFFILTSIKYRLSASILTTTRTKPHPF
ncbi:hypothetical protein EDB19DRAFT_767553 [Suillus lakei]|nr:hypothetical protein EDB19DRAFT_767553 [Suillus lakei]